MRPSCATACPRASPFASPSLGPPHPVARTTPPRPPPPNARRSKQDREISAVIKRLCDEKYGPTWQCIVGEDFKASFTHETKHFMFIASGKQNAVRWPALAAVLVARAASASAPAAHFRSFPPRAPLPPLPQLVWKSG